jgi:hypothetical protein
MRTFSRLVACLKIAIILAPCFLLTSCACWSPVHADEPACRDLRKAVDCEVQNVAENAGQLLPVVTLITTSNLSQDQKDQDLAALMNAGVGAVACAVRALQLSAAPVIGVPDAPQAGPQRLRARANAMRAQSYADHFLQKNHVTFKHEPKRASTVDFSTPSGE